MKIWRKIKEQAAEPGQSLVETALVLPILIIMLVGIVELSNVLNTQNKITTASRIAAGFGAANYDRDDFADTTAQAMGQVALNTVTETLVINPDRWDIWSIKARTNDDGTAFSVFTHTKVFGTESVVTVAEWNTLVSDVQSDMLASLQSVCEGGGGCDDAADIEVVASVPWYAPDPFLGLPVLEFLQLDRQRGLTVMRVGETPDVAGCPLLPIAVRLDQWSLYPSNWCDQDTGECAMALANGYGNHPVQPFPPRDNKIWEWPACQEANPADCKKKDGPPIPSYENASSVPFTGTLALDLFNLQTGATEFYRNVPGTPLSPTLGMAAPVGYIFWAREEVGDPGNFGWLTWDGDPSAQKLEGSLGLPAGDFMQYYPGSRADNGELVNINHYDEGERSGDGNNWLEVGEWVEGAPGNMDSQGKQGLQQWIYDETLQGPITVSLVLFDERNEDSGSNLNYRVAGFVMARMLGYSFGGAQGQSSNLYDGKWILFELLGPATQCYNPPDSIAEGS